MNRKAHASLRQRKANREHAKRHEAVNYPGAVPEGFGLIGVLINPQGYATPVFTDARDSREKLILDLAKSMYAQRAREGK